MPRFFFEMMSYLLVAKQKWNANFLLVNKKSHCFNDGMNVS